MISLMLTQTSVFFCLFVVFWGPGNELAHVGLTWVCLNINGTLMHQVNCRITVSRHPCRFPPYFYGHVYCQFKLYFLRLWFQRVFRVMGVPDLGEYCMSGYFSHQSKNFEETRWGTDREESREWGITNELQGERRAGTTASFLPPSWSIRGCGSL